MKKGLIAFLIVFVGFTVYWIKNLTGTDFVESCSLSKVFPFKYFGLSKIVDLKPGEIFVDEDFEDSHFTLFKKVYLTMGERGGATQQTDPDGINKSHCLLITSRSEEEWSYLYRTFVRVSQDDEFIFKGMAKVSREAGNAAFAVSSHAADKTIIEWEYVKYNVSGDDQWTGISGKFQVVQGISFIRFFISGTGKGEYRFDDIIFQKLH